MPKTDGGFANSSVTLLFRQQIEVFAKLFLNIKNGVANAVLHKIHLRIPANT